VEWGCHRRSCQRGREKRNAVEKKGTPQRKKERLQIFKQRRREKGNDAEKKATPANFKATF
jgi:hypothetical protein